jgi:hypothetical protein
MALVARSGLPAAHAAGQLNTSIGQLGLTCVAKGYFRAMGRKPAVNVGPPQAAAPTDFADVLRNIMPWDQMIAPVGVHTS